MGDSDDNKRSQYLVPRVDPELVKQVADAAAALPKLEPLLPDQRLIEQARAALAVPAIPPAFTTELVRMRDRALATDAIGKKILGGFAPSFGLNRDALAGHVGVLDSIKNWPPLTTGLSPNLTKDLASAFERISQRTAPVAAAMAAHLNEISRDYQSRFEAIRSSLLNFRLPTLRQELFRWARVHGDHLTIPQLEASQSATCHLDRIKAIRSQRKRLKLLRQVLELASLRSPKLFALLTRCIVELILGRPLDLLGRLRLRLESQTLRRLVERSPPPPEPIRIQPQVVPNAPGFAV